MGALVVAALLLGIQLGLLLAVLVFTYRFFIWIISGYMDAPFVPTPTRYAELVGAALALAPGDVVYELGSGNGAFMLAGAALSPATRFVGIEQNPLLHATALILKRRAGNPKNVEFRRGNFYREDLSKATKLYTYLLDSVMFQLRPKLEKEFRGRVASRAFPIPGRELSNVIELTDKVGAHGQHLLFVYDF